MPTVNEQWSIDNIPVAIKMVSGFNEKFKMIRQAMMLPPPLPVSVSATEMSTVTQVLASAQNYQNNASAFRLGRTPSLSSSTHNLPKVKSVLQERQQRVRTALQKDDHMIAVIVSLWRVEESSKEQLVRLT